MCGIAGFVTTAPIAEGNAVLRRMASALARRGPDGEGFHSWPTAHLAHRRLAIFDLSSAGLQPMLAPDGGSGVVFNGAIYNFLALRAELEEAGYRFLSRTDTEVLVHGYAAWGIDQLVRRLHGMFAFGLWDEARGKLFLVRDRLGVKPMLYSARQGRIAFASTLDGLRPALASTDIDEQAVAEFLEFGYVSEERTIYQDALKLPAAHVLEWHDGRIETRRYWQPSDVDERHAPSFDDAVAETEKVFLRATEMRLQADVPVGALLSGGVDSSLVCWAVAKLGGDIKAFTVGTPDDIGDETSDAVATARTLGLQHEVIPMRPEDEPDLDTFIAAFGEPFACASALGMLRVSQAVRKSATVLLTGDGGDEAFFGYDQHYHLLLAQRWAYRLPGIATDAWSTLRHLVPHVGILRRAGHFLDYTTGGLGAVTQAQDGWPYYQRHGLLGERLKSLHLPQRQIPWSSGAARRLLTDWFGYHLHGQFAAEYMTKVDGATMFHALEARSPFLDQTLWEFATSLPYSLRLTGDTRKAILRALARKHLGDRVAIGQKRGFTVPVQRWLAGRWAPLAREAFEHSRLVEEGWIDKRALLSTLNRAQKAGVATKQLWYLFVLECWRRREQDGSLGLLAANAA